MNILGIDSASSSVALTAILDERSVVGKYLLGKPYSPQNPIDAYNGVHMFLSGLSARIEFAFLEQPVVGYGRTGNVQSTIKQSMVSGAIQVALAEWDVHTLLISNTTWKKEIGVGGNASKITIRKWLHLHHPSLYALCTLDQDRIDASCIALYGCAFISEKHRLVASKPMPHTRPRSLLHAPHLHGRV
jgi:Holliday junction resolvasome RuvABC endonuclease subunit